MSGREDLRMLQLALRDAERRIAAAIAAEFTKIDVEFGISPDSVSVSVVEAREIGCKASRNLIGDVRLSVRL